jgi:hypothetical protein
MPSICLLYDRVKPRGAAVELAGRKGTCSQRAGQRQQLWLLLPLKTVTRFVGCILFRFNRRFGGSS